MSQETEQVARVSVPRRAGRVCVVEAARDYPALDVDLLVERVGDRERWRVSAFRGDLRRQGEADGSIDDALALAESLAPTIARLWHQLGNAPPVGVAFRGEQRRWTVA